MKIFNKLVRDKIPEIIKINNESCKTRILSDEEYLSELNKKIQEEMKEYLESGDIEELADMEEVLRAILDAKKCSYEEFEKIKKYMKDYRRKDFIDGIIKVTGRPEGYRCLEKDVPKVEEILVLYLGVTTILKYPVSV